MPTHRFPFNRRGVAGSPVTFGERVTVVADAIYPVSLRVPKALTIDEAIVLADALDDAVRYMGSHERPCHEQVVTPWIIARHDGAPYPVCLRVPSRLRLEEANQLTGDLELMLRQLGAELHPQRGLVKL